MSVSLSGHCIPSTFMPTLFGIETLSIQAHVVTNYTVDVPAEYRFSQPSVSVRNATFCNVTVTYTHPGENDQVNVETWLPVDNWNERLQAVGGGGWNAGRFFVSYMAMAGAVNDGFATVSTDAGVEGASDPKPWALLSPGNVNLYKFENFGSRSLNEQAVIGKSLIKSFYGMGPTYSYWNGCSQGGRQGLMLAQRYPTAYDGISANAPALYWSELASSIFWPQQYMNMIGQYPYGCELDALTAAAISMCDGLDGIVDGVISDVDACSTTFDSFEQVGTLIKNCSETGTPMRISKTAAQVVNATWSGMISASGKQLWHGINIGSDLTGNSPASFGLKGTPVTNCSTYGPCVGMPSNLATLFLQLFVAKDPDFDYTHLSHAEFDQMVHRAQQQYNSIFGTNDPDLSDFRDAGGKMITFHGLGDQIIPTKGTDQYYREVSTLIPDTQSFYRYFPVPGLGHCVGGPGGKPTNIFSQLQAWVENGTAPDSTPVSFSDPSGKIQNRIVCPYPQVAKLANCDDPSKANCWSCVASSTEKGFRHTRPLKSILKLDRMGQAFQRVFQWRATG